MSRLAVIATLYGERGYRAFPALQEATRSVSDAGNEVWWMVEDLPARIVPSHGVLIDHPTPRNDGRYAVIPYSNKINWVLNRTSARYVTYLTDDSLPHPEKYERMVAALDEHPEWGAVYVGQRRNGSEHPAHEIVADAYCRLDHTQVAHRLTADRWPLDVGRIRLGDAIFWRSLHASLGAFYPVEGGILDTVEQTPDGISSTW